MFVLWVRCGRGQDTLTIEETNFKISRVTKAGCRSLDDMGTSWALFIDRRSCYQTGRRRDITMKLSGIRSNEWTAVHLGMSWNPEQMSVYGYRHTSSFRSLHVRLRQHIVSIGNILIRKEILFGIMWYAIFHHQTSRSRLLRIADFRCWVYDPEGSIFPT